MTELVTFADLAYWPLLVASCVVSTCAAMQRQLAGFTTGELWKTVMILHCSMAAVCLVKAMGTESVSERTAGVVLAAMYAGLGYIAYRVWKHYDDGQGPRKRIRKWIKARLPRMRQLAPVRN